MDQFRNYYISSILPELKQIEEDRIKIEKKLTFVGILSVLIILGITVLLIYLTHNLRVIYIFITVPFPFSFFYKDLIKYYSRKYKKSVIKNLFLSYFESYVIDTEKQLNFSMVRKSGFFLFDQKYKILCEDFISVTHLGFKIDIQEILIKRNRNIYFKGILCSMVPKHKIPQTLVFINEENKTKFKYFKSNGFKSINNNKVDVLYNDIFDINQIKPYIDFTSKYQIPLSIQDGRLFCIISSDNFFPIDNLDLFEPKLLSKYNSNDTFRFVREEYNRIGKFAKILIKLEEINMA